MSSHNTHLSSHMQLEVQELIANILDGHSDWTKPGKELQVLEFLNEELEHCQMKKPVEHYRHATAN